MTGPLISIIYLFAFHLSTPLQSPVYTLVVFRVVRTLFLHICLLLSFSGTPISNVRPLIFFLSSMVGSVLLKFVRNVAVCYFPLKRFPSTPNWCPRCFLERPFISIQVQFIANAMYISSLQCPYNLKKAAILSTGPCKYVVCFHTRPHKHSVETIDIVFTRPFTARRVELFLLSRLLSNMFARIPSSLAYTYPRCERCALLTRLK